MSPLAVLLAIAVRTSNPCTAAKTPHVAVVAEEHQLFLCEQGSVMTARFGVRLAAGGRGKRREGDRKLPIGTYPLGTPRPSAQYGTFIPIGYPTAPQRKQGFTGGGVGVHGPDRRVRWLGHFVNALDSTDGCVGLATDEEMAGISAWLARTHAATIVLR